MINGHTKLRIYNPSRPNAHPIQFSDKCFWFVFLCIVLFSKLTTRVQYSYTKTVLFCILLEEIVLDWLESRQNLPIPQLRPAGVRFRLVCCYTAIPPTAPTKQLKCNEKKYSEGKKLLQSHPCHNRIIKTNFIEQKETNCRGDAVLLNLLTVHRTACQCQIK